MTIRPAILEILEKILQAEEHDITQRRGFTQRNEDQGSLE